MKVKLKDWLEGYSGRVGDSIYYYHPKLKRTLMRKMPKMPVMPQNTTYKNVSGKLKALKPSEAYKNDFRFYLSKLSQQDPSVNMPSWYPLFVKMMWALQAKYPQTVNLQTITRAQIESQNLPCRSVKAAIADGLLPQVQGWEYLTQPM